MGLFVYNYAGLRNTLHQSKRERRRFIEHELSIGWQVL